MLLHVMYINTRKAIRVDIINVMKYVPSVRVFAVISVSSLFIPLDIDVVPINSSFKNILLFIPIIIPMNMLFGLNALVIMFFIIKGTISKFLIIMYVDIIMKNVHIIGTILFSILDI